jgi:hypothetical protein
VFRVDGEWFIHTREGIAVGPYGDKFAADVDAEVLKSLLVGTSETEALAIIQEFMGSGCRNLSSSDEPESAAQRAEVAALLSDDEDVHTLDNVRLLS